MGYPGRKESLALLEAAYDTGIRHFDVAPMYGDGAAEGCLGEFLARHSGNLTVTTKYGIPPASRHPLFRLTRRIAGSMLRDQQGFGTTRSRLGHLTGVRPRPRFSVGEAEVSLHRSLKELRRERIDLWLLHEAEASDLGSDELLRFLEKSEAAGKIGSFGVGSSAAKVHKILEASPAYCNTIQFEWSILDEKLPDTKSFRIHHRALANRFKELRRELNSNPKRCRSLSEAVGADLSRSETLARLMLAAALVYNPKSIVLFSSNTRAHIQENVGGAFDRASQAQSARLYEGLRKL